jgi:hypothetical protein
MTEQQGFQKYYKNSPSPSQQPSRQVLHFRSLKCHISSPHARNIKMATEVCLAKAAGFNSILDLIASPWPAMASHLYTAVLNKAISEREMIFIASEWLAEQVPGLGLQCRQTKSPIVTTWCNFLSNLGCRKTDIVIAFEDAVKGRVQSRGQLPYWGLSIGLVQVQYNRTRAEEARIYTHPEGPPAPAIVKWNRLEGATATESAMASKSATGPVSAPASAPAPITKIKKEPGSKAAAAATKNGMWLLIHEQG